MLKANKYYQVNITKLTQKQLQKRNMRQRNLSYHNQIKFRWENKQGTLTGLSEIIILK
jgi:hypothetical protein